MADMLYHRLYEYAQRNRLDYNELCREVRAAVGEANKEDQRERTETVPRSAADVPNPVGGRP